MKVQDFFDYRRWAESLKAEAESNSRNWSGRARQLAVSEFWTLSEWCEKFDRAAQCLNWNDTHTVYQAGVQRLRKLCTSL